MTNGDRNRVQIITEYVRLIAGMVVVAVIIIHTIEGHITVQVMIQLLGAWVGLGVARDAMLMHKNGGTTDKHD